MRGLAFVTRLARASLYFYPESFRQSHQREFVETIAHRWHRERRSTNSAFQATARACLILCADTASAAPGLWRDRRHSTGSTRPPRRWFSGWGGDLRLAARHAVRQPLAAALVVITLGLGLGLGVASFGALDRIVLRPLPVPNGERIYYASLYVPKRGWRLSPHQVVLDRWRAGAKTIVRLETYSPSPAVRTGIGPAAVIDTVVISGGLPSMLGATPIAGRMLGPADGEPASAPAAMLTERAWRRDYGADRGVVGRPLRLDDRSFTIVGVWPDRVRFSTQGIPDVIRVAPRDDQMSQGGFGYAFVELAGGAAPEATARELTALLEGVEELIPGTVASVMPSSGFRVKTFVTGLWAVFAASVVLMLVAVVNSANVLLGRAAGRTGELGVRLALGASLPRLARLFLAESLVLTAAGVTLGAVVATIATRLSSALAPAGLPIADGGWLEPRPLAFGAAAALVAVGICALVPVWRARAVSVREILAGAGGTRTTDPTARLHKGLIAAQAALAVLLVVGAALMGRSLRNLAHVDPGFDVDRLAVFVVQAPEQRYPSDEAAEAFTTKALEAFAVLPGVTQATVSGSFPFSASIQGGEPFLDGEAAPPDAPGAFATWQTAPPGYFATLGIDFVAGREFVAGERGVVIVNESFARAHGGNVVGRRLRFSRDTDSGREIVGVVRDIQSTWLTDRVDRIQLYGPKSGTGRYTHYVLRTSGPPEAILALARSKLAELDPDVPLRMASTGPELFAEQTARHGFVAMLLLMLASLGVLFAISGVYGMVSLDVGRRLREVGLRMALGATAAHVVGGVIKRGLVPVAIGGALGTVAAIWMGPFLEDLLFEVPARDPWSLAAGFALVAATAIVASSLPARRASRIDPTITLRAQ